MNRKLSMLLMLFISLSVFAQQTVLTGKVVDAKNGRPLTGANVILRDQNQYAETNNFGEFKITTDAAGRQIIDIIFFGFEEKAVPVDLRKGETTQIGTIQLNEEKDATQAVAFVVDESQINDEDGSNQTIGSIGNASDDVYLKKAGYTFSPMRFSIRGYNQEYQQTYINGVAFNDGERGRFNYSSLGGMNSMFKNRTVSSYTEANSFSYGDLAGASNINARSSNYAPGSAVSLAATNRSYVLRASASYATGLMPNGWAFNAGMIYRWSHEGAWDGTFYNSWGYFLGVEKVFNPNHSLSLITYGAPTQRGQQAAVTQEVYDLAGSIYYNPYWGYQNGKKRNSRVVESWDPTAILSYEWKIDRKQKLNVGAGFHYSNYSSTALTFYNAPDPRPDYYLKLPSFQTDPKLQEMTAELWKNDPTYSQINWDGLYHANQRFEEEHPNASARYAVEERHNNLLESSFNAVYNGQLTSHLKVTGGIEGKFSKGMHYKTMSDLLGASRWIDRDQFAERDFDVDNDIVQNDLNHPNRKINVGDRFGYDYDMFIYNGKAFAQNEWTFNHVDFYYAAKLTYTNFHRYGHMLNGRAVAEGVQSEGKGKTYSFFDPSIKAGFAYKIDGHNRISVNALAESRAPLAYNAYISPRIKDTRIADLKSERILSYDINYNFNYRLVKGRVSAFRTHYNDVAELMGYYDDTYRTFINSSISGLNKLYQGVEAAVDVKINNSFSVTAAGTWADYKYTNNGIGTLSAENGSIEGGDIREKVYTKNLYVNSGPQIAASLSLNYFHPKMWFADITGSYYAKNYLDFAPSRRMETFRNKMVNYIKNDNNDYDLRKAALDMIVQEELPSGFMLDASVGKVIYLNNRAQSLNINLSASNILNNTKMITGGYQQGRTPIKNEVLDPTSFSKYPNKYYYAQGFNVFLNVGYKF
ncbi:MAG: TonB-dependent receptor [Bacteroidales bacterium]